MVAYPKADETGHVDEAYLFDHDDATQTEIRVQYGEIVTMHEDPMGEDAATGCSASTARGPRRSDAIGLAAALALAGLGARLRRARHPGPKQPMPSGGNAE